MGDIRETLVLADSFSQTFRNFDAAANAAINVAETFQKTLNEFSEGFLDGLVSSLNDSRQRLEEMANSATEAAKEHEKITKAVTKTDDEVKKTKDSEDRFRDSIKESERAAGSLMGTISKIAGAIGVVKLANEFIQTADEMSQITAKLNLINDGVQTTAQLQNSIYESAQRTRSSYQDTAQLVARLGMNTGNTFKNNAEMIAFAENLNKSFKIAGASGQEQASVILQMSQALASGLLRGQEFNAVMSGAPNIIKNIADYMGVTVGQMRDLAAEGQITSDKVKNAMLSATKSIDAQFRTLPKTFEDVTTTMKNQITVSLNDSMQEWINKVGENETAINNVTNAITTLASVGGDALLTVANGVSWISENWEAMKPIIEGVGLAIIAYKTTNLIAAAAVKLAWAEVNVPLLAASAIIGEIVFLVSGDPFAPFATSARRAADEVVKAFEEAQRAGKNFTNMYGSAAPGTGTAAGYAIREIDPGLSMLTEAKGVSKTVKGEAHVSSLAASTQGSNFYNAYYGSRYTPNDELFMKNLPAAQAAVKAEQEREALRNLYVAELNENAREEERRAKALEEITNNGVKVKNEVKLSSEDLQIFRDIAENRYIANVSLETLAPSVSVNVENNGQNMSEDDIASAVTKALETQISEHTAISHG